MSREDPQLRIWLPSDLKDKIDNLSKVNSRSMNAEIVSILQGYFDSTEGKVRTGNVDTDRELQRLLVSLRRHAQEQDMLLNDFVHILNKKTT